VATPYPQPTGQSGGSLFRDITNAVLGDVLRGGSMWLRVQVVKKFDRLKSSFAQMYDAIADATPDTNVGISPDGISETFEKMCEETAKLVMYLSSDIADEMYAETIQEAFSNAIQYNLGGALQSILNVWRGAYPPSYDEIDEIITCLEDMDSDLASLLIAQAGSNIPTTQWRIQMGFNRLVDDKLLALRGQMHEVATRMNDMSIWLHDRAYTLALREFDSAVMTIRDAYERAIGLIDQMCERTLARLFELKGELETMNNWWTYTKEHPDDPIVDAEEVYKVALENLLEAQATYNTLTAMLSYVDSALEQLSIDITDVINKVNTIVNKNIDLYNQMLMAGQLDLSEIRQKIDEIMQKVSAYRHSVNLQSEITLPSVPLYQHITPTVVPSERVTDKVTIGEQVEVIAPSLTRASEGVSVGEQVSISTYTAVPIKSSFEVETVIFENSDVTVEVLS